MKDTGTPINQLAMQCAYSDRPEEWEEFVRCCAPIASLIAARVCRSWTGLVTPALVDDIVQEIFLKLCERERKILRSFVPRGSESFIGLLSIISASVANDHFRRQSSGKRGGGKSPIPLDDLVGAASATAPERSDPMRNTLLYLELDRKMCSNPNAVTKRDRAIFWLYYRQGLTAQEIASLPAVTLSAKGVESVLRRVAGWLKIQLNGQAPDASLNTLADPG